MPETATPNDNNNSRWRAFLPISLVAVITTLDGSVVNVSLPVISEQLQAGIGIVDWVVMAYLLTITGLMMISGRIGDLRGRRRIYQAGIILFTAASALCGFAVNIYMLIASRALQGVGAALITGNGPALLGEIFPKESRGKAMGLFGMVVAFGLSTGPAVGGFVTGWLGWRYIFYLNLPLGILAAILVRRNLRADTVFSKSRFDISGGISMALGLFCLLLALSRGSDWGWSSPIIVALLAAAIFILIFFVRTELRVTEPVLDLSLFSNLPFRSAALAGVLGFTSLFAQTFLLPFYLIQLRHFAPQHAGLFLMAVPLIMAVASPTSGSLSDKIGTRGICIAGLLFQGIGFLLLSSLQPQTSELTIFSFLLVIGLGTATFNAPNNSELLSSVPKHRLGNAAGMMGLTRTFGMVCGIALSSAVFNGVSSYLAHDSGDTHAPDFAFIAGLRWAFWLAAVLAWFGAIIVWQRGAGAHTSPEEAN